MKQGRILKKTVFERCTTGNQPSTLLRFFEHKKYGSCVRVGCLGLSFFSITELEAMLDKLKKYDK